MSIMIRTLTDKQIETLKKFTGESTASKALVSAASQAMGLRNEVNRRKEDCRELAEHVRRMQAVIDSLMPLCTQIQEQVGQKDILDERLSELEKEYCVTYYHRW